MHQFVYIIVLAPLFGALIAGLFGTFIGRRAAHWVTTGSVFVACLYSCLLFKALVFDGEVGFQFVAYEWAHTAGQSLHIGFLIDRLTVMMLVVVTFVSLMVHVYTIGYMQDDPGYQRFFSYIALFTFAMIMLVSSDNFLQLFFGWEAVGLVSYLLIGFWFKKEAAIFANLKAFLVNRVGDLGFLIGIATVFLVTGSLNYSDVFARVLELSNHNLLVWPGVTWPAIEVACIGLFIGAMGKSAQVPLHVWLPDSMEGPTPISALIHAATMVTAGVFMLARLSVLFEFSEVARSVVLVIGSLTCFFMGLVGVVQNDIKRVVAYSTLSQLGYMVVAAGASAYAAGIFHLMTHAFFKALLFLGAGAVIIALHHEQDIRKMGKLYKAIPITYITFWIGTLALTGIPPLSGFFSKDAIIEAVAHASLPGAELAYWAVLSSVFVTSLYSFRLLFLVFHSTDRMTAKARAHVHEPPKVVWVPLVLLAIPSMVIGALANTDFLYSKPGFFGDAITVLPEHDVLHILSEHYHGVWAMVGHGVHTWPFWLAIAGFVTAFIGYQLKPGIPLWFSQRFSLVHRVLMQKYGFDAFNQIVVVKSLRGCGQLFSQIGDRCLIDGIVVNGSAKTVAWLSKRVRHVQTGYLSHYVFAMVLGVLVLVSWLLWFA